MNIQYDLDKKTKMKLNATIPLLKAMFKVYPYVPDEVLLFAMKKMFGENQYPYGQMFLERALVTMKRVFKTANPKCREAIINNMVVNEGIIGQQKRKKITAQLGFDIPLLLVISPTQRCPLKCYGCYSAEQNKFEDLPFEVLDRLITEAKEMGQYFFVISGGEPFIYKGIFDLWKKHSDAYFQVYTSGVTLAKGDDVAKIAELGNVFPCISVEGFEKETEERRGKGHYRRILDAMANLRKAGVPFGYSATATSQNNDLIVSDELVDFYVNQGCSVGYYFQYMPIGRSPVFELVPTTSQRLYRYERINTIREERKDIVFAEFWCDGPLVGGCLAGGRRYLHINSKGDVEPCVFAQAYDSNIKEKSLMEILQTSKLLASIRKRQPYSENLLRPCMVIDVPEKWQEVLKESGATLSYPTADNVASNLVDQVNKLSDEWKKVTDPIWYGRYHKRYQEHIEYTTRMREKFVQK